MKGGAAPRQPTTAHPKAGGQPDWTGQWSSVWRRDLVDRRECLLRLAGGSLLALFPLAGATAAADTKPATALDREQRWAIIGAVQGRMFPSEADAPGATEIHALPYLRRTMAAPDHDPAEFQFLLEGAGWLDGIARQEYGQPFQTLGAATQERVMRRVAASQAGDNWLSTLLLYLLEALLTDPVYGGNPGGIGWQWLRHTPGFPLPPRPYYEMDFYSA